MNCTTISEESGMACIFIFYFLIFGIMAHQNRRPRHLSRNAKLVWGLGLGILVAFLPFGGFLHTLRQFVGATCAMTLILFALFIDN